MIFTVFVHEPGFMTAALLSYKGLDESLNCCFSHLETEQKQTFKINSKVVTATFSNYETTNLKKPINLTFYHLEVWNNLLSMNYNNVLHQYDVLSGNNSACAFPSRKRMRSICVCFGILNWKGARGQHVAALQWDPVPIRPSAPVISSAVLLWWRLSVTLGFVGLLLTFVSMAANLKLII